MAEPESLRVTVYRTEAVLTKVFTCTGLVGNKAHVYHEEPVYAYVTWGDLN